MHQPYAWRAYPTRDLWPGQGWFSHLHRPSASEATHIGTQAPSEGSVDRPGISPTETPGPSLACPAAPILLVGEGRSAGHAHPSTMSDAGPIMKHINRRVKKCSSAWQAH